MIFFLNLFKQALICLSAILLILLIYFQSSTIDRDWIKPVSEGSIYTGTIFNESFDKKLLHLNTMKLLEEYFLSEISKNNFTTQQSVIFADNLLRERFIHRNINIKLEDNWFLYLFNFMSSHRNDSTYLSSLDLDYILKFDGAICNQQALIFQKLMKSIGLDYKSVLFNIPRYPESFGHFASAVKIENEWFFVDTNLEPAYDSEDSTTLKALLSGDVAFFNFLYPTNTVEEIPEGAIKVDFINENPALYGKILQNICYFISWYGWIVCVVCYLLTNQLKKSLLKLSSHH